MCVKRRHPYYSFIRMVSHEFTFQEWTCWVWSQSLDNSPSALHSAGTARPPPAKHFPHFINLSSRKGRSVPIIYYRCLCHLLYHCSCDISQESDQILPNGREPVATFLHLGPSQREHRRRLKAAVGHTNCILLSVKAKIKRNVIGNCNYWKELSAYSPRNYGICKRPNWW